MLITLGIFVLFGVGMTIMLGPILLRDQRTRTVLQTGIPAIGHIISSVDTGSRSNAMAVVDVTVLVNPDLATAYQATFKALVSPLNGASFAPGRRLNLKVDQKRPDRVALVGLAQ